MKVIPGWLCIGPIVLAGCASNPAPVNLVADPASTKLLAGEWTGTYSSRESGRSGSIVFTLIAGDTSARGDVLMIPTGREQPVEPYATQNTADQPKVLTIEFVRAASGKVSGRLAPYKDPNCGCPLDTTFDGEIKGDRITGTFVSYHIPTSERQSGTWEVERRKGR